MFLNGKTKLNQKVCRKLYSFENFHIKTGYLRKLHTKKIDSVSKYPLTGHHVSNQAKHFEWNSTTKLSLRLSTHGLCITSWGSLVSLSGFFICSLRYSIFYSFFENPIKLLRDGLNRSVLTGCFVVLLLFSHNCNRLCCNINITMESAHLDLTMKRTHSHYNNCIPPSVIEKRL